MHVSIFSYKISLVFKNSFLQNEFKAILFGKLDYFFVIILETLYDFVCAKSVLFVSSGSQLTWIAFYAKTTEWVLMKLCNNIDHTSRYNL